MTAFERRVWRLRSICDVEVMRQLANSGQSTSPPVLRLMQRRRIAGANARQDSAVQKPTVGDR
jgi:hypothetical protein